MYEILNMLLEFGNKNNNSMPSYVSAMKEAGVRKQTNTSSN